jgi:hypothetical protein
MIVPTFQAYLHLQNIYTNEIEGMFVVMGQCNSADLFVTRISRKLSDSGNTDVRMRLIHVINMDAQSKPRGKRQKGK